MPACGATTEERSQQRTIQAEGQEFRAKSMKGAKPKKFLGLENVVTSG